MMGFHLVVEEGYVTISEGQTVLNSFFLPNWRDQMEESLDGGDYVESVDPLCSQSTL
jgi:hypothetical protein